MEDEKLEKKHGGARPGAGMPKGKKTRKTIEREIELAYIKERVSRAKETIIDSQLTLARGVSYLYRVDKDAKGNDKKPELVTAQYEIEAYLSGEADVDSYYYITTIKPENSAIDSLLDRTVGKPTQGVDLTSGGKPLILPASLIQKNDTPQLPGDSSAG